MRGHAPGGAVSAEWIRSVPDHEVTIPRDQAYLADHYRTMSYGARRGAAQ
jgi:hypothetical protein